MNDHFLYSLRLGVDPRSWDTEKTEELKKFVNEGKIDDINIIINSEELNVGHITEEELQPWLKLVKDFKDNFKNSPVTISMNPWTTVLHSDRGRQLNEALSFQRMVDYEGRQASAVACPASEAWQDYIAEIYGVYAQLEPHFLWLDDDFRHFNHKPLIFGCFCEDHMEIYREKLGKPTLTRSEFVKEMLQPGEPTEARRVYLAQASSEMKETASKMASVVYKISPSTKLGLMTSQPEWHALEGRDWSGLFENFAQGGEKVSRPHLPAYNEISSLKYIREFNRNVRPIADMMGPDASMYPELENYMYSTYVKSNKFTQLQLETTALIGAKGILFNFFDMMGNGVVMEYDLQKVLAESKPFLNYLLERKLDVTKVEGVKCLYSENSVALRHNPSETLNSLLPREYEWLSLLSTFGITATAYPVENSKMLKGEVVALNDQIIRHFTDEELRQLFNDNQVLLDGPTVEILFERQLNDLIGATSMQQLEPHSGAQTYEQVKDNKLVAGVRHARMTVMQQIGTSTSLVFDDPTVEIVTEMFDENGDFVGNGMAQKTGKFFILPIAYHDRFAWDAQYILYKEKIIKNFLNESDIIFADKTPVVEVIKESEKIYMTNFSADDYTQMKLRLGNSLIQQLTQFKLTTRQGTVTPTYTSTGDFITIKHPLNSFETVLIEYTVSD